MRLKTLALAACISGFALASCNSGGSDKPVNGDSTNNMKKDSIAAPKKDSSTTAAPKDTMKMDTSMNKGKRPIVPSN